MTGTYHIRFYSVGVFIQFSGKSFLIHIAVYVISFTYTRETAGRIKVVINLEMNGLFSDDKEGSASNNKVVQALFLGSCFGTNSFDIGKSVKNITWTSLTQVCHEALFQAIQIS